MNGKGRINGGIEKLGLAAEEGLELRARARQIRSATVATTSQPRCWVIPSLLFLPLTPGSSSGGRRARTRADDQASEHSISENEPENIRLRTSGAGSDR